ncbi:START domain-containing protein, partial [Nemorincola caseinilytica]|uniref:START domain-containing protein n=1 Tax=Nemorincola caseinilytica TaxID=2054315 RepID=UPI0031EA5930
WVYSTSSASIVKRLNNYELIYYTEKKMPWPLSNRDVVMQMKLVLDTVAGTLIMTAHSIENMVPLKSGVVRVPASEVTWKVSTISPGTMKIEYSAQADPGGTVPAWVTNMFLTKGPYETFTNLRKQLRNN